MAGSEYFADKRLKKTEKQEKLKQCDLGVHTWSVWFYAHAGLARECLYCQKIDYLDDHSPEEKKRLEGF